MTKRRCLLASVAALALSGAIPAAAAEAPSAGSGGSVKVDEVVVTGSRIRGVAPVGSALTALTRDDIVSTGATTTADVLLNLPSVTNLGISEASRASNGGATNFTYSQGVNIHGIGPAATLLLVDGRRMTPQGAAGNINDVSIVPTIALERVELVPDGASALYGSDAIAGVANLILRRHFEGVEASARYGAADHYEEGQAGLILGHDWGSGYGTFAYGYSGHSRLRAADRDFSSTADLRSRGGSDFRSNQCNPGTIVLKGVTYPLGGAALTPGPANRCDVFSQADLLPEISRNSFVGTLNQDLTSDISVYATGLITLRDISNHVGLSTANLTVPSSNAFFVTPVPGTTSETVSTAFTEVPTNDPSSYANFYQATVGAKFKLPEHWQGDAAFTFGKAHDMYWRSHGLNSAAITAALASSNPATAYNPFGGKNSPSVLAAIGNSVVSFEGKSDQEVADLGADGPLFSLPGGEVRLAVGYQHVSNRVRQYTILGVASAPFPTLGFAFRREVDSAYAELLVPLVGDDNALPGVQKLTLDVAGRYDHYNDAGETTNPKIGINWEPTAGLRIHASYGTSFRAPPLISAHSSATTYVTAYPDPLAGGANVNALQVSGGNVGLKPETATTYSVGADFEPEALPGLKASINYFDVDYRDIIAGLAANTQILNQAAFYQGLGIIQRNPSAADVAALLAKFPLVAGVVPNPVPVIVDVRSRNLAAVKAQGLDLTAYYAFSTDMGYFSLGLNGTYYLKYATQPTPGQPPVDQLGTILNPVRFQGRGSALWRRDALTLIGYVNYTSSYDNNLVSPVQKVDSHTTLDLHAEYDLGQALRVPRLRGLKAGLDVTNVFDSDPPFVNIAPSTSAGAGYDGTLASPIGRLIAVSLTASF